MLSNAIIGGFKTVMSVDKIFNIFNSSSMSSFFVWSDFYDSMYDYIAQF